MFIKYKVNRQRSNDSEKVARSMGLLFSPGIQVHDEMRGFELTDNEYSVEVVDMMSGKFNGHDIEVFDCLCHGSAHSGNPPKRITVLLYRTDREIQINNTKLNPVDIKTEYSLRKGFHIFYKPGVRCSWHELREFVDQCLSMIEYKIT